MTTYYVGSGGNDGNAGTSWGARKLTLTGAEDIPVAAGDTVYVGPGTYRETLTVDVSGSSGNPITYIGDYTGANTDGAGGVVRITGSADDTALTRNNAIVASSKNYRTFRGFTFDLCAQHILSLTTITYFIIDECHFTVPNVAFYAISSVGASQSNLTISNCGFRAALYSGAAASHITMSHSSTIDNTGHAVTSCYFEGGSNGILVTRLGGVAVKNCTILGTRNIGAGIVTIPAAGQTMTVNNCILQQNSLGLYEPADAGDWVVEDYNAFADNNTDRTNVAVGANSGTARWLGDTRWFHEMGNGGTLVTPWDMASYCTLVNVAGTSPPATDMRGTSVQGAQREWGPLEYDSTLDTEAGSGGGRRPRIRLHGA